MDPGHSLLQHLKTIPNLVNEDPSITTPQNTAFAERPWSDLSKLVPKQPPTTTDKTPADTSENGDDTSLGNWDSQTGYQDKTHKPTVH
ncbi:hypothetical protein EC973_000827 [Apophysomyces ossiformis]|uniref:Uncharacterized protein n=1 Tax=Apophysomyces ossiformis TaxID=679940 RepID=A0A8H7ESC4_9FUNG|nr:hypothetical protein EC973_000827 [Apophysomyces ossiformis]